MEKIILASTYIEYKNCFDFFKNMWRSEFNLDLDNESKIFKSFLQSKLYYIGNSENIISVIQFNKVGKGYKLFNAEIITDNAFILHRIGVLKNYRNMGYGKRLITYGLKQIVSLGISTVYIPASVKNIDYYSKFGFNTFGKEYLLGNTKVIYMKNNIDYL